MTRNRPHRTPTRRALAQGANKALPAADGSRVTNLATAEGEGCAAPETRCRASGLRLRARGEFEPFLDMRTSLPRNLTSAASRLTLLRSITASPSLLAPRGMRISERRASLKRVGRSAQHRCQPRGARPCIPYQTLSSGSGRFDSLRVHRASNDRTSIPTALLRSDPAHLAPHADVPPLRGSTSLPIAFIPEPTHGWRLHRARTSRRGFELGAAVAVDGISQCAVAPCGTPPCSWRRGRLSLSATMSAGRVLG